jgi:quercetin dioxygenase-like cupin family protein
VGETLSIGVVRFRVENGADIPPKAHSHGEEFSLQLAGGCAVVQAADIDPQNAGKTMRPGTMMVMPADLPHYGINHFGAEGISHRLNVVTPPRREYGETGAETVFYPICEK